MPFRLGPMEIGLLLLMVLIFFGVGKLPQVGGAIGKSIREFRQAQGEDAKQPGNGKVNAEMSIGRQGESDNS